jgi:hypothetical protein
VPTESTENMQVDCPILIELASPIVGSEELCSIIRMAREENSQTLEDGKKGCQTTTNSPILDSLL